MVHHAGAGTTGAAVRAGVPSTGVPVFADQPLWSARLASLEVGPAPVPMRRLTANRLADAMRQSLAAPRYAVNASRLAETVRAEDGAEPVLAALESIR
ncbi:hypothetical protein E1288_28890 [Saccharopolyspora elongata]|uniref:Erythromycin biosynthesis protein CIII-like C-terminal domain-containing protein n=1 Tax=Saccharopolyspora elongata TaxID=2530387 RepID=A0A4R4YDS9_9PSEU|nr:hypothetical protein E1288_28890 [Saccharopolyspora elongata]